MSLLLSWSGGEEPGAHLPREEQCHCPQRYGDAAVPCAGHLFSLHTAHGIEGSKQEGQTDKAWQSAGQCSRAAPGGTAWVWV